jgi:serine/threonine protein kinase
MTMTPHHLYSLEKKVAKTIYGGLYLGKDRASGEYVAVKLCDLKLLELGGKFCRENPVDEIQLMLGLQQEGIHENVIVLKDAFEHEGSLWMVMEYASGGELFTHVMNAADTATIDFEQSLTWFSQMAEGLSFIHQHGVAHLDVSLENCLIDDGVVKICDFGLAQKSLVNSVAPRTGKTFYMAPEVAFPALQQSMDNYDPRQADVYSLGVSLFMMCTGFQPYESPSPDDPSFLTLFKSGPRELLRLYKTDLPEDVLQILDLTLTLPHKRSNLPYICSLLRKRWRQTQLDDIS